MTLFAIGGAAEEHQCQLLTHDSRRAIVESHDRRTMERLAIDDREPYARRESLHGEIPQPLGILVADFLQHDTRADLRVGQWNELSFFDFARGGRDRRAVRIVARLAQRVGHPLDQLLGYRVLETLCLDVHVAPVVPELARQIDLEDSVAPDHLERGTPALDRKSTRLNSSHSQISY